MEKGKCCHTMFFGFKNEFFIKTVFCYTEIRIRDAD